MNSKQFQKHFDLVFSPKQVAVFDSPEKQKNLSAVEGVGKTFLAFCMIIDKCIFKNHTSVFFVSPTAKQSREKERRIQQILFNSGKDELISHSIRNYLEFVNESKIYFFSAEQKVASVKGYHSIFEKEKTNPVVVLIDDATSVSREFAEGIFASLFTASDWNLILCYNPASTDSWVYEHNEAGLKDNPNIKTFEFSIEDNPLINKEILSHLKGISPDYIQRYSGQWDSSKFNAFPEEILRPCIDNTYQLNALPVEKNFSYTVGCDLNDLMAASVGRDRDKAVFLVLAKKVDAGKIIYKIVGYNSFQRANVTDWLESIKRFCRIYPIQKILVEQSYSASLLEKIQQDNEINATVETYNPHSNKLKEAYQYLNETLHFGWLKIPYDAKLLLKELRELKVETTSNNEIRFYHKRHHHNDHIIALAWALLGMKDINITGHNLDVDRDIIISGSRLCYEHYHGYENRYSDFNKRDREFLEPLPPDPIEFF